MTREPEATIKIQWFRARCKALFFNNLFGTNNANCNYHLSLKTGSRKLVMPRFQNSKL